MSKEKQIEEMAKELCNSVMCDLDTYNSCRMPRGNCSRCQRVAEDFYNAGYCKQSEVGKKMSYRETNNMPADRLIQLSDFICEHLDTEKFIMVDFFEEQMKRHIDLYALIYYTDEGLFSFETESVNAILAIWQDGEFVDTADWEKELFTKEHGFYKFKWTFPGQEVS